MTEAELIESAGIFYALVADMLSIYLSATTGFLIVAYVVGSKLTRGQLTVVSSLYLIFALVSSYLVVGYGFRGMSYMWLAKEVSPNTQIYANNAVPTAMGFCLFGGIIASLYFMRSIRHPKTE